jgi:glucosamine-6-phosphate deaminase
VEIKIVNDYLAVSEKAAAIVAATVERKSDAVLGLATGSTPEGMYSCLVQMYREQKIDFGRVTTFNLDEYFGLAADHPQSYYFYMHQHFFNHVNIDAGRINLPSCAEEDIEQSCLEYDQKIIASGGIDLQVLGVGTNGHIGFNEPNSQLTAQTHLVNLTSETIEANSRFFDSPAAVPRQAVTMGMASIMHASKIMLLATGAGKSKVVQEMCSGKISTGLPASLLQLHRDVILLVDAEAAALL